MREVPPEHLPRELRILYDESAEIEDDEEEEAVHGTPPPPPGQPE